MDGRVNPANVFSQVTNDTFAHVTIQVASSGTYKVFDPLNNLLAQSSTVENNVTFTHLEFGSTGWYTLKQGDAEVTRFQVIDYPGSVSTITTYHVIRGWIGPTPPHDFRLQRIILDDGLSPPCQVYGQNDASRPVYVPANTLTGITFLVPYVSHPPLGAGPYLGGKFSTFGEPTIVDASADKVIWRNTIYPDPLETNDPVYWMTYDAIVQLGIGGQGQITLDTHAETELRSVIDPTVVICNEPTDVLSIPVIRQ